MSRTDKRAIKAVVAVFVVLIMVAGFYLFSRVEVERFSSPSSDYYVIVSKRRFERFVMRAPGDGGSAPGFIEVISRSGESFGRVPVATLQLRRGFSWTPSGAEIPLVAEWDFKQHTCFYWSESQERQIWVRR
jgi:hypothetical protein